VDPLLFYIVVTRSNSSRLNSLCALGAHTDVRHSTQVLTCHCRTYWITHFWIFKRRQWARERLVYTRGVTTLSRAYFARPRPRRHRVV